MRSVGGPWALPAFRNAYLRRGIAVWIGVRIGGAFVGIGRASALQSVLIVAVVGLAVTLDARRRGEDVFLGNLGIGLGSVAPIPLAVAALGEALARLVP